MSEILVAPLGRSPGAVSGLVFALNERRYGAKIDKVVTVGTNARDVHVARKYLQDLLLEADIVYDSLTIPFPDLRDRDGSTKAFIKNMGLAIEEASREARIVHVSVTSGRSGMGALTTLAAALYEPTHLWHFWVDRDIEDNGTIDRLPLPISLDNIYLNPTKHPDGVDAYEAIELPKIPLNMIQRTVTMGTAFEREHQDFSDDQQGFQSFLRHRFSDVFPGGLTYADGDRIKELATKYYELPDDEKLETLFELFTILNSSSVIDAQTKTELMRMVIGHLDAAELERLARRAKDRTGFWAHFLTHRESITVGSAIGSVLLQGLQLWMSHYYAR